MKYEDLPDPEPEESELEEGQPPANNPDPTAKATPEALEAPAHAPQSLAEIPPDAEMNYATLTCWNGQRFVSWQTYLWEQLRAAAPRPLTDDESRNLGD